jgi:hypothetical protein
MLRLAFLALPFQMRQRRRLTSSTITVFACILARPSADKPLAVCVACWNPHRYVEPIEDGWRRDSGIDQDSIAELLTAVGSDPHRYTVSAVQRRLIERAVNIHIRLAIMDSKFAVLGENRITVFGVGEFL